MPYTLLMFEPGAAPSAHDDLKEWWNEECDFCEDHSYEDPRVTSPNLRQWYLGMSALYPPGNLQGRGTASYRIGRNIVYVEVLEADATPAYEAALQLARTHRVGLVNASGNAEVWLPDARGSLALKYSN